LISDFGRKADITIALTNNPLLWEGSLASRPSVESSIEFTHVRFWHQADMPLAPSEVRFRGKSGHAS
jgi:hypothetical protein